MPPAKRRKVGLKRIDAALDALRPMGFSSSLVRKTVSNLLKIYGGDEGWSFIEDCSYKLLIETILEMEIPQDEDNEPMLPTKDGRDKVVSDQSIHSPTSNDAMPSPSRIDHADEKLEASIPLVSDSPSASTYVKLEANIPPLPDFPSASTSSSPGKKEIIQCSLNDKLLGSVNSESLLPPRQILPEEIRSPVSCSPLTAESLPPRKTKPCYGWLSSDDEEEQDNVL